MSTSDERIAVFQDTMNWIDSDPDLSASISVAKKNTTISYGVRPHRYRGVRI